MKWLWLGVNSVNYFGENIHYDWREYDVNGNFTDFSEPKRKYCFAIAPEIRFSFINTKSVILYGALSGGIGWEGGYDKSNETYPHLFPYYHITYFGISGNLGKNKNITIGGELGISKKGILQVHAGYRF